MDNISLGIEMNSLFMLRILCTDVFAFDGMLSFLVDWCPVLIMTGFLRPSHFYYLDCNWSAEEAI